MFIHTEKGHSINTVYLKGVFWTETCIGDGTPFLVYAEGQGGDKWYLTRERTLAAALCYIDKIQRAINGIKQELID